MIDSIKRVLHSVFNFKENKDIAKWLIKIGHNYKRYIFGFLAINLITMLMSLASSIAGRYVVDSATHFGTDMFFSCILIMLVTTVISILISSDQLLYLRGLLEGFQE